MVHQQQPRINIDKTVVMHFGNNNPKDPRFVGDKPDRCLDYSTRLSILGLPSIGIHTLHRTIYRVLHGTIAVQPYSRFGLFKIYIGSRSE